MCGDGSYGLSFGSSGMLDNTQRYMSSPFLSFQSIKIIMFMLRYLDCVACFYSNALFVIDSIDRIV